MGNQIDKKVTTIKNIKKKMMSSDNSSSHNSPIKDNTIGIEF